jgi:anti-sigma B factor antagonist
VTERTYFLRGEIDISSAPEIERRIQRAIVLSDGELVIDCYDLTFIDSTGVAMLLRAGAELASTGRSIRIANANATTLRLFELLDVVETLRANFAPSDEPARPPGQGLYGRD